MATVWLNKVDCESGALPGLCLRCGRRTDRRVEKDFHGTLMWVSPWSAFESANENTRLLVPLCDRHRGHWRNRCLLLGSAAFVLVIAVLVGLYLWGEATNRSDRELIILAVGYLLLIMGLPVFILRKTGLRAVDVYKNNVEVTGVSSEFADAYQPQVLDEIPQSFSDHWEDPRLPQKGERFERGGPSRAEQ